MKQYFVLKLYAYNQVMDATTLTECAKLVGHNDGVCYACMSDDENTVLSSSHDNLIIVRAISDLPHLHPVSRKYNTVLGLESRNPQIYPRWSHWFSV